MGRASGIIRAFIFVVLFALVQTYFSEVDDFQANVIKTFGVMAASAVITWVLVWLVRRSAASD